MVDPVRKLVMALWSRGVKLAVREGKIQCRAPRGVVLTEFEKQMLVAYAPFIEAMLNPDESLPDELRIPASVPNNVIDIQSCIDAQRVCARRIPDRDRQCRTSY